MKYIRTKDGRIMEVPYGFSWNVKKTLAVADTIEELCDELVLVDTETGYCGILNKEIKFDKVNMGNAYGRKFYSAIWVKLPNGAYRLEPVAKLSEKGELELL